MTQDDQAPLLSHNNQPQNYNTSASPSNTLTSLSHPSRAHRNEQTPEQIRAERQALERLCAATADTLIDVSSTRGGVLNTGAPGTGHSAGESFGSGDALAHRGLAGAEVGSAGHGAAEGSLESRHSRRSVGAASQGSVSVSVRLPRSYAKFFAEAFPARGSRVVDLGMNNGKEAGLEDSKDSEDSGGDAVHESETEAQWLQRVIRESGKELEGDWERVNGLRSGNAVLTKEGPLSLTFRLEDVGVGTQT